MDDIQDDMPEGGVPEERLTFDQELRALINKHSMENFSGTPDWILMEYLMGCLRTFDIAVKLRADWRGESVELPALQELRTKKVPLVIYEHGRRNEIGEATITKWPGERATADITGVIPVFSLDRGEYYVSINEAGI